MRIPGPGRTHISEDPGPRVAQGGPGPGWTHINEDPGPGGTHISEDPMPRGTHTWRIRVLARLISRVIVSIIGFINGVTCFISHASRVNFVITSMLVISYCDLLSQLIIDTITKCISQRDGYE